MHIYLSTYACLEIVIIKVVPTYNFAVTVTACLILFIFPGDYRRERAQKTLLRPAFLHVAMQWHRRPEITVKLHYAFSDFEAGLCSGARVMSLANELPCTLMLGLVRVTTAPRDTC